MCAESSLVKQSEKRNNRLCLAEVCLGMHISTTWHKCSMIPFTFDAPIVTTYLLISLHR